MMNLVNELQVSAEKDDVLTVLRKTKRLASKLGLKEIADWLLFEHDGYPDNKTVPDYRRLVFTFAYRTNGYVPAGFGMAKNGVEDLPMPHDFDVRLPLRDSISVVLQLIESSKTNQIHRLIEEGSDFAKSVRSMYNFHPNYGSQFTLLLHLNEQQMRAIPDRIKDRVLDWALALEEAKVTGENMSFNEQEKNAAQTLNYSFYGCTIEQVNNMGTNQKR